MRPNKVEIAVQRFHISRTSVLPDFLVVINIIPLFKKENVQESTNIRYQPNWTLKDSWKAHVQYFCDNIYIIQEENNCSNKAMYDNLYISSRKKYIL